jgi:hypothetical protein
MTSREVHTPWKTMYQILVLSATTFLPLLDSASDAFVFVVWISIARSDIATSHGGG